MPARSDSTARPEKGSKHYLAKGEKAQSYALNNCIFLKFPLLFAFFLVFSPLPLGLTHSS